jgi:ABC-2 type transport system ATP-binding protein
MPENAIVVEGLIKRFKSLVAIDGIDFEVPAGTVFGLLGPNGAGKTTAIRILATILHPDGGRATVMGYDVVHQAAEVRYRIGLAGQNAAVDPNLTGRENLQMIGTLAQMPGRAVKERASELLADFDLSDAADRPLRTYSGGMRRRLDVAAALVQRPPVIFLDEPTTGLDIQSRSELWVLIRNLVSQGSTVLLTTQYLEEADRLSDRIAVLDVGRVVANDSIANLKSRLGTTVIDLEMESVEAAERAEVLLAPLRNEKLERNGTRINISSANGPEALYEALHALNGNGLGPKNVSVHEPSLDDVFLSLTGHRAVSEEPGSSSEDGGAL